jgi:type I restriction enzyme S subunit
MGGITVSYPAINASDIGNLPFPSITKNEQIAIASFLDRETARVDALVEKKQQQIELLQEKRASIIIHAVTKGLDPKVKFKDSGIEWLGDIPNGWRILPIKYIYKFYTGWTPPTGQDEYFEGENPWANISDLGPKYLMETVKQISDSAIEVSRLKLSPKGSLLFSFKLSIGQVSIAGIDLYTNEAIATFPPDAKLSTSYLYWAAPIFITKNADENIYGAKLLNQELIKNAKRAFPSDKEQRAIADFLDRETARIDALIEKVEQSIDLLEEYRSAIITDAVTGKIDVRREVA